MFGIFDILRDNWLRLLVGQYPSGPLGGICATLILSVLGIVMAFPVSVMLALARLSPWRALRVPATVQDAELRAALEGLANELMVDIELADSRAT